MGLTISSLFQRIFGNKQVRILMVGLDAAGKTTILYKLKLGEIVTTIPTIGIHIFFILFDFSFSLSYSYFILRVKLSNFVYNFVRHLPL